MCSTDIFLGLLALLFPPLAVWVKRGVCSADSIINILLCILGYLPGLIHAWYIIAKYPEPDYEYVGPLDAENGRGQYYVFVRGGQHPHQQQHQHIQHHQPRPLNSQGAMNYGTTAAASPHSHRNSPIPKQTNQVPIQQDDHHEEDGAGPSNGPLPPSYAQVVAGDHKVQTQD